MVYFLNHSKPAVVFHFYPGYTAGLFVSHPAAYSKGAWAVTRMIDNDNKVKDLQAAYDELRGYALRLYEICNEQNLLLQQQ